MSRKNFRKIIYEAFSENSNLPKTEIIKIAAKKARSTESRIWHELEKRKLSIENNENILKLLGYKNNRNEKKNFEKDNIEPKLQSNIETIINSSKKVETEAELRNKLSKEILENLYVKNNMNIGEISKTYHLNKKTVKKWLIEYGIPLKSRSEVISIFRLKGKTIPTKEELLELRAREEKSVEEIANMYKLSIPFVRKLIKKYGLDKIDKKQFLRIKLSKIKSETIRDLDNYKALKSLIDIGRLALQEEDAFITASKITSRYLEKLNGIYRTFAEDHTGILEELYLIYKNNKNKLESLLLHCLYNSSIETGINPLDIKEDDGNFLILQKVFFSEIRKLYIEYKIKNLNK